MKTFLEWKICVDVPNLAEDEEGEAILSAIENDRQLSSALEVVQRRLEFIIPTAWKARVWIDN